MSLQLQFVGEIFRCECGIHRPHVVGLYEVGIAIAIGVVHAAQCERFGQSLNAEQFDRRQHARQRGIGIGTVKIAAGVETTQNTGRIPLAGLLLDTQTIVILTEVESHEVERGARRGFEAQRTAHCIHIATVDIAVIV